jgi:aryl-alcohol dehydrogenase-like predicted oxidoreductase
MQYVRLGRSGLKVSRLCLGTANFGVDPEKPFAMDASKAEPIVARALEQGINFFDTAETYTFGESEKVLGAALKKFVPEREDVVISTKFGPGSQRFKLNRSGMSRKHILNAIDESLDRLQTDYVDIYTIHRLDDDTPFEETCEALDEVVRSGKARYVGASSMFAWQFERMVSLQERYGWAKFVLMQNQYSVNYREEEREMVPLLLDRGIAMTPWGVLSAGLLAGTITRDGQRHTARAKDDLLRGEKGVLINTDQDFDAQDRVRTIAEKYGVSLAQIGMAWALSKPYVTSCLIGASRPKQVDAMVAALSTALTVEDLNYLEANYQPLFPQTIGKALPKSTPMAKPQA